MYTFNTWAIESIHSTVIYIQYNIYIYNNYQLMHNTYFDAVYDGCHVLFLVYLSCEMGDNRGI